MLQEKFYKIMIMEAKNSDGSNFKPSKESLVLKIG